MPMSDASEPRPKHTTVRGGGQAPPVSASRNPVCLLWHRHLSVRVLLFFRGISRPERGVETVERGDRLVQRRAVLIGIIFILIDLLVLFRWKRRTGPCGTTRPRFHGHGGAHRL